ncbi:hypothetical protein [Rhodococcoides fascians]|uniref:hypothetical protein n=1 Tax=Rhodococcoides fascians TaxID=1828 RepID=UPI002150867D|nr:hypothetical protein [Rhodococcus fascians]
MNGRPPHSYDREGDLSHYRSVFEAIERRVIPEVVITRVTPYLLVLVSAAVLGVVLPHTGGAHGYDVLLRPKAPTRNQRVCWRHCSPHSLSRSPS